jgi:uncharacterized phage protein gp47/JayE
MPFFPREERDIVSEALQRMNQQTNITQLSPGAKARFFLATTGREQSKMYQQFDENLLQPYIRYSSGKFLDYFGDMLNLPRYEATHAEAQNDNFMFYVQSGKFGDINGGPGFTIPAGAQVSTLPFEGEIVSPGLETQPVITYTTTEDCLCDANASYAYVPIRATVEGDESSVPRNVLNKHNFSTYRLVANGLLLCTNRFAIDNGVNRETDDSYRYRLANLFKARAQAIEMSIRLAALSVPGVSDVVTVNAEQGPGTYALYIKGITPTVSPSLVTAVSWAVNGVTAYGIRPFVSAPVPLGVELVAAVNWSPRATAEEISVGYASMRNAAESFINDLDIGENLDLNELMDIMLGVAPKANRIGKATPNAFEEVYIYKQTPSGSGTIRNLSIGTVIEPLYNQRVILETGNRYRGVQFITF